MPDKKTPFGRKAQDEERLDPNEYVFGKQDDKEAAAASAAATNVGVRAEEKGSGGPDEKTSEAGEPMVRITVDVRKSLHKQLQRVCSDRELKLSQFIRQLIEKELRKTRNAQ